MHGASSPSRTFHVIFVHQDVWVFLVSKLESVKTTHGKDKKKKNSERSAIQKLIIEQLTLNQKKTVKIIV